MPRVVSLPNAYIYKYNIYYSKNEAFSIQLLYMFILAVPSVVVALMVKGRGATPDGGL